MRYWFTMIFPDCMVERFSHESVSVFHQGNIRAIAKEQGDSAVVEQSTEYYPYGAVTGRSTNGSLQPHKYNGKELLRTDGIDVLDYGARWYDSLVPHWYQRDRFCEKYYHLSPYGYCGSDPINRIDINGDSIFIKYIKQFDSVNNTDYAQQIINDWSFETGLAIDISKEGFVEYAKDVNGSPIINQDERGNQMGSISARNFLIEMINCSGTVVFVGGKRTATKTGTNIIGINPKQIEGLIAGTSQGLDSRTLGWGMTIMHELKHTMLGGGFKDDLSGMFSTGPVVDFMNTIRAELNAQGFNFGKRLQYRTYSVGNVSILPFANIQQIEIK